MAQAAVVPVKYPYAPGLRTPTGHVLRWDHSSQITIEQRPIQPYRELPLEEWVASRPEGGIRMAFPRPTNGRNVANHGSPRSKRTVIYRVTRLQLRQCTTMTSYHVRRFWPRVPQDDQRWRDLKNAGAAVGAARSVSGAQDRVSLHTRRSIVAAGVAV